MLTNEGKYFLLNLAFGNMSKSAQITYKLSFLIDVTGYTQNTIENYVLYRERYHDFMGEFSLTNPVFSSVNGIPTVTFNPVTYSIMGYDSNYRFDGYVIWAYVDTLPAATSANRIISMEVLPSIIRGTNFDNIVITPSIAIGNR